MSDKLTKNENIRKTLLETREKRLSQKCKVFKIKINESRLSSKQKEALKMLFVEAKWIYNDILNFSKNNDISNYDSSKKVVTVKNKDGEFEERPLNYIGSQMKQATVTKILNSIKGLSVLKKNGKKIGALKFKSDYCEINLKCYDNVYKFHGDKRVKIAKVPGKLVVNGLDQFINNPDI